MSVVGDLDDGYRNNPDYYEYLMLCQRHASSNFIHKVDSSEVVWMSDASHVKMIGRYLLGDQIGKGAFGKVKEGLCAETLQRVAVKIVNKKRLRKMQGGVEGVVREMKLLRRLKHRNIITLVDVYCKVEDDEGNVGVFNWFSTIEDEPITWRYEDGTERDRHVDILKWYLVFEYCPCSLQVLLEQAEGGKLPIPRAHHFFVQLMEGINFLHLQGVIHRDIKPGNMLITPDNHLKISDFGIAEQFSGYTNTPMIITSFAGTHQFLAPEIAEGLSQFSGEKADVWACGITLFNMVTGRYPFEFDEDGNLLALYEKIMGAGFATPPEVSPDLKNLFDGMLEKDPDKRLSTAQVLTHPWTLTFFEESLRAPPPIYSYPARSSELNPTDPSISTGASLGTPAAATVGRSPAAATPKSDMRGVNDIPSDKEHAAAHSSDQPKHSGVSSAKRPQHVTPCETTLIPYLEQLFADEIEEELEKLGRIDDHLDDSRQGGV
ncbi:kinase-like domain-containing protein [Gaertneriomyces semiglobifer]|nr:kinase-like domain-containing protein [Gaertneriomyces semiglobifer]